MRGGTRADMDRNEYTRHKTQTGRQAHGYGCTEGERDQALPHEAPESNPSQKTKEEGKK